MVPGVPNVVRRLWEGRESHSRNSVRGVRRVRALVTHSLRGMPEALWPKLPSLELIANFGAGLEGIDLQEAARRCVRVTYTPDSMTHDVADLAFTHLLALSRRLVAADAYVRLGSWGKQPFGVGRSTQGRRVGILGLGRMGKAIARRAPSRRARPSPIFCRMN